jgi:hypothetical protein
MRKYSNKSNTQQIQKQHTLIPNLNHFIQHSTLSIHSAL